MRKGRKVNVAGNCPATREANAWLVLYYGSSAKLMATYRIPVLLWQDFQGFHTASLVEWEERVAVERTAADALNHLKDYLAWLYREKAWPAPDFRDAHLVWYRVPVRPEYQVNGRPYPCDEQVVLRIPCVQGQQEGGLLIGALPTLNVRFYYYKADSLEDLVRRYVLQKLQGLSPQQLSRCLPPPAVSLEEIVLQVPIKDASGPGSRTCPL